MEIRKLYSVLLIILSLNIYAQKNVLSEYPLRQDFYAGGIKELNKEMVKIVKEQKLLPCEKSEEEYTVKILVNENSKVNYVKDFDSVGINNNKCAFDFTRKIIPHLERWIPAKENGMYVSAITTIKIKPFYLYHSKDDPSKNETKNPTYKKGLESFQNELLDIFEKKVKFNEDKRTELIFVVNEKGEMEDFKIIGDFSDDDQKEILKNLSRIKGKWNPALFNDVPVRVRIRQPIVQKFNIDQHIKENEFPMNNRSYLE